MFPMVLILFAFMVDSSTSIPVPLTFQLPVDSIYDNSYASWNTGVNCRGISCSRVILPSDKYITSQSTDALNWVAPTVLSTDSTGLPITYPAYLGTVDVTKANYVRGSATGTTEVGTRDEVSLRPSVLRSSFTRPYSSYFAKNLLRNGIYRYPPSNVYSPLVSDYAFSLKRPVGLSSSSLVGWPTTDSLLYLKK